MFVFLPIRLCPSASRGRAILINCCPWIKDGFKHQSWPKLKGGGLQKPTYGARHTSTHSQVVKTTLKQLQCLPKPTPFRHLCVKESHMTHEWHKKETKLHPISDTLASAAGSSRHLALPPAQRVINYMRESQALLLLLLFMT
mgnify:CR=1 FL=1